MYTKLFIRLVILTSLLLTHAGAPTLPGASPPDTSSTQQETILAPNQEDRMLS